jgi:hypothetical protein
VRSVFERSARTFWKRGVGAGVGSGGAESAVGEAGAVGRYEGNWVDERFVDENWESGFSEAMVAFLGGRRETGGLQVSRFARFKRVYLTSHVYVSAQNKGMVDLVGVTTSLGLFRQSISSFVLTPLSSPTTVQNRSTQATTFDCIQSSKLWS